ncbi:MAG: class I SAM-dependent methyltransferase [Anaerolineae bacterium]|nr:class I SAM-dependent methyltransferase [Anaerolineae bacterium]
MCKQGKGKIKPEKELSKRLLLNSNTQTEALQQARLKSWGKINLYRLRAVERYAGQSVLDIGCSTGDYVTYLNVNGRTAFGLDVLADGIWVSNQFPRFVEGSASKLPFAPNTFDTVLAFEVLEHIPEPLETLKAIHQVCKRNIIISVPDCEMSDDMLRAGLLYAHWRDRTHCNFFTQQSLEEILRAGGFRVEKMTYINPILPDFLVLRSFNVPFGPAYFAARVLRRIPFRKQYRMTLLAVANKV